MLYLRDGDFLAGRLTDCDEANIVRWQMQGATQPFDFPADAFGSAFFPPPPVAAAPDGDYSFELSDGDLLFGSLVSITPEQLEIQSSRLGRLHIARGELRRMTRRSDASADEYRGPNGLGEWQQASENQPRNERGRPNILPVNRGRVQDTSLEEDEPAKPANQWRDEAGRLITSTPHAMVQKEIAIPARARIEFEIAWVDKPQFILVFSSGKSEKQLDEGLRFEVWQGSLVVLRALGDRANVADVAIVGELDAHDKRVHVEAFLDRDRGSVSIHALDGKRLAEIEVPPKLAKHSNELRWITLINGRGDLRLERLAVSRWSGQLPSQVDADKPRVYLTDGTVLYGDVIAYDADAKRFVVRTDTEEKRVDATQVACVMPSPGGKSGECSLRVGLHDGSRYSGELSKVAGGKIYVSRQGIEEPLACPIADVRSLAALSRNDRLPDAAGRVGRLELDGVRCHGSLVEATVPAHGEQSCLTWRPRWSTTSSPLAPSVSGRIVYRDPPPPPPKADPRQRQMQPQRPPQQVGFLGAVVRVFTGGATNAARQPQPDGAGTLYLLAGDRIPCRVSEIDEAGVYFTSSVVSATFLPHGEVKALELVPNWTAAALAEEKRQRLLTLPRMQKGNPPTHLVVSTTGDFLRTRITSMSADTLVVESRLETKQLPRNRVACLIWLQQDASDVDPAKSSDSPSAADDASDSPRVQAIQADGVRLTFVPRECTGEVLLGASKLLGDCRVKLINIDALILGSMIDRLAGEQAFQEWKLSNAVEPRYLREAAAGDGSTPPPVASGLIGKPAPDFRLDLLEGGQFALGEQKGHVVVLDFWASWCGPCMQAMPQVDAVVAEFAEQGVELVAVNMLEDRTAASGALERLKINPAVALDVDGAAAEHYQVTAIPQTVVIDSAGNVAQLFIGTGSDFPDQLRTAIQDLLKPPAPE